jgi:hypothetical protein
VATDLDRVLLCVVAERHRHDVRLATRVGRGDTPEALVVEEQAGGSDSRNSSIT